MISSEGKASRKVSILKLFPSDCITLYDSHWSVYKYQCNPHNTFNHTDDSFDNINNQASRRPWRIINPIDICHKTYFAIFSVLVSSFQKYENEKYLYIPMKWIQKKWKMRQKSYIL